MLPLAAAAAAGSGGDRMGGGGRRHLILELDCHICAICLAWHHGENMAVPVHPEDVSSV